MIYEKERYSELRDQAERLQQYSHTLKAAPYRAKIREIAIGRGKDDFKMLCGHSHKTRKEVAMRKPSDAFKPDADELLIFARGESLTLYTHYVTKTFRGPMAENIEKAWLWIIMWTPRGSAKWVKNGEGLGELLSRVQAPRQPRLKEIKWLPVSGSASD
jgi:hypothetical protein